ncbi:unknown [Firmicutes bacterium CAG:582]|nr:unknown [Firmicutes bacterium CAG:582]
MKKNKYALVLVLSIFVISLVVGFIYGINNPYDISEYVKNIDKNMLLFNHLLVVMLFFFSTISLIGILINGFYIGFEGVSVGFVVSAFFRTYGIKGIIYSLINLVLNKGLFIIILFYLFIVGIKYVKKCLSNIVGLSTDYLIVLIKPMVKKYLLIVIFSVVYDLLNYFLLYKLVKYFTFIL